MRNRTKISVLSTDNPKLFNVTTRSQTGTATYNVRALNALQAKSRFGDPNYSVCTMKYSYKSVH